MDFTVEPLPFSTWNVTRIGLASTVDIPDELVAKKASQLLGRIVQVEFVDSDPQSGLTIYHATPKPRARRRRKTP